MTASDLPPNQTSVVDAYAQHTSPPWYYRAAIAILKPFYRLLVWRRSRRNENYRLEVAQRFGHQYPAPPSCGVHQAENCRGVIWCHAVSLGETNTVAPLLEALLAEGYAIWLTNTTHTGYNRGEIRFAKQIAAGSVSHSFVPVDSPAVIDKFLAHVQPIAALFVETELWASILSKLAQQQIPSILVNARLTESSFLRYQKIASISAGMMQNLSLIIAQDADSAKRFRRLGAASAKIRLSGSLKWVVNTPQVTDNSNNNSLNPHLDDKLSDNQEDASAATADRVQIAAHERQPADENQEEYVWSLAQAHRPVWVAASTHEGEEAIALEVQQQLLANAQLTDALLILVPRHPERFDSVAQLVEMRGLRMTRRSLQQPISADTQVYLADSMGELMHWYQMAQVAFVGGSLVDVGGHNPIEALSVATPVIMGPYTQSCHEVVQQLQALGVLFQLPRDLSLQQNKQALYEQLQAWLSQPEQTRRIGELALNEVARQQRVLPQQLQMIFDVLDNQMPIDSADSITTTAKTPSNQAKHPPASW